jgi:hypothetical protein
MKHILTLLGLASALFNLAYGAQGSKDNLKITPIVGFERVQKFVPSPHMKTRLIYGAQAVYALPFGAAEAEYTHGQDNSIDLSVSPNVSYKDVEDKIKLGLRGTANYGFLSTYLRGGAQGRQNKQTKTVSGTSTTSTTLSKVQPYLGTGVEINLLNVFSLNADITAVYAKTSDPNLSPYEISPSLGFSLKF